MRITNVEVRCCEQGKRPIENGKPSPPQGPGLGMDLDWDETDRCTRKIV